MAFAVAYKLVQGFGVSVVDPDLDPKGSSLLLDPDLND